MDNLTVEIREGHPLAENIVAGGRILITPPLDEDYWLLRVKVSKTQAIVAFPKFGMLGVGFQKEEDWNTNLPWSEPAEQLFKHIKCNKGSKEIKNETCIAAIKLLQETIFKNNLDPNLNKNYQNGGVDKPVAASSIPQRLRRSL